MAFEPRRLLYNSVILGLEHVNRGIVSSKGAWTMKRRVRSYTRAVHTTVYSQVTKKPHKAVAREHEDIKEGESSGVETSELPLPTEGAGFTRRRHGARYTPPAPRTLLGMPPVIDAIQGVATRCAIPDM